MGATTQLNMGVWEADAKLAGGVAGKAACAAAERQA